MWDDMSEVDMRNIERFTSKLVGLGKYRKNLHEYLANKQVGRHGF